MTVFNADNKMYDHEGNLWAATPRKEWEEPLDGEIALDRVAPGTRVSVNDYGHGPYLESGFPDCENGGQEMMTIAGVLDRFEEEMTDDGLWEKFAVIIDDSGSENWVAVEQVGLPIVGADGRLNASAINNVKSYAKGANIIE